jgi:Ca2+-binding RTX toxin-like protein
MTTYKDVTLTPPPGGGTLAFHGTDANERILFSDPQNVGFEHVDAKLDLGGGNDLIPSSSVADFHSATATGGAGDDNITLFAVNDVTAHGGSGNDALDLTSDQENVFAFGGGGNDVIAAGGGSSATAFGGGGNDGINLNTDLVAEAHGGDGDDVIVARGGGNDISGGLAFGGAGNDKIDVDGGNGQAFGGAGNDTLTGQADFVLAHGGSGDDRLTFSGEDIQLFGDAGNDRIDADVDSTDEQSLYGGTGNDTIRYTLGDKADAAATVDLYGGAGKDQLYAGAAHDVLHFLPANTPAGAGRDVVHGYQHGQDHIALDGGARYTFVGETKNPGAGEVGYYHQGHDTIVDGCDGKTQFEIQLQGFHGHLDASDFIA